MKKYLFLLSILFCGKSFSQNYNVSLLSDSLKKNADAVKRFEEIKVIIKSPSHAVVRRRYAVTVLKESGADQAAYINSYDKLQSLEHISGTLYDAAGKELKNVKKKDIGDYSANGDVNLVTDNRIKRHNFYYSQYPYTVEYEDEQDFDGIFFLPSWRPVEDIKYSVEQSSFIVETPADFGLRYKQVGYTDQPQISSAGDKKTYTWQIKNFVAQTEEPYHPSWSEIDPAVYIAPSKFEIENYKGDMSSWLGLGKFISELNKDRQQLPENVKQDVHRIADALPDDKAKAAALYDYLQKNTRYISIQLGIGSWQPFNAGYVASKKYGDCKALSNYMVSLLKEAGVPARYVIITAGDNRKGVWEDFPAPYFNHAIVCVPGKTDTTWLECTSQTASPGYMGSFTGNRTALLIDEEGGHIVNTPVYKASDNLQLRKIDAVVDEQGTLTANVLTRFTGQQQDERHMLMHEATSEQKQRYLNTIINLPTYSVEKFSYTETKGLIPSIDETLSLRSVNFATMTGKRVFITPNFFNRSSMKLSPEEPRKYDIEFPEAYMDADTIHISIPADYTVEALPKSVNLSTVYGKYSIDFSVKDNMIDVLRKNEMVRGTYPKSAYKDIAAYLNEIYKADRGRIVLIKKEN